MKGIDWNQYRKSCYCKFSGGQLEEALLFVDAIEKPRNRFTAFATKYDNLIEELANKALKGEIDHYDLYNGSRKYLPKLKYQQSHVLQDLVFFRAGAKKRKASRLAITEIGDWWEKCGADFYLGYEASLIELKNWLAASDWDSYLANVRDMEGNNAVLLKKVKEEYNSGKSDEELIKGIHQYNDGSLLDMSDEVSALAWMIKTQNRWNLYAKVIEGLKYYPYQGALLLWLRTVEDCKAVMKALHGCEHEELIQYLLREHTFRMLYDEEHCLNNNAEGTLPQRWRGMAKKLQEEWTENKGKLLAGLTKEWLSVFGGEKMSEWVSEKKRQSIGKSEMYRDFESDVLEKIERIVKKHLTLKDVDYTEKDLSALLGYALSAEEIGIDENEKLNLFRAIVAQMYQTCYCPEWQLNEKGFNLLRSIYGLLPDKSGEGIRLLKVKHKPQEGYKVDHDKAFNSAFGEAFLLSVLLLQTEVKKDVDKFSELVDLLYKYCSNGMMMQDDQFFIPFYVAELVVCQILKDKKDEFETKMIVHHPHLPFVLRVLTANGGEMSGKVRETLQHRVIIEWEWEKKLMMQRKNKMWEVLEKFVSEKVMINENA